MERGTLKLIAGNMFSNKTGTLIHRIETLREFAHKKVFVIKPTTDTRSGRGKIKNSQGKEMDAVETPAKRPKKILEILKKEEATTGIVFDIVAIDEVQFFAPKIFGVVGELLRKGYDVIAAGLLLNFRGEPFGSTLQLIGLCRSTNEIELFSSYCAKCGDLAAVPQRLIDGKPASYTEQEVLVGGKESYEARCYKCHELPGKPIF